MRVTDEFVATTVKPRLTKRDIEIIEYVHFCRIVTTDQIARVFWKDANNARALCNRRLRLLKELKCVNSYYPVVEIGSPQQHFVLESAGAKILNLKYWNRIPKLPMTYRHRVLVNEVLYLAEQAGLEVRLEFDIGGLKADLYIPKQRAAIEVDTGTETYRQLEVKAKQYNNVLGLKTVAMLTEGTTDRLASFFNHLLAVPDGRKLGATFSSADKVIDKIKKAN